MSESTAVNVTATGQTGGSCQRSGPYRPGRNTTIVMFFKSGERFPPDPVDGRATVWTMVS